MAFAALSRRSPDASSCGSAGNATSGHLTLAKLWQAGVSVLHVPYRGSSDAARDLATGSKACVAIALQSVSPVIQSGRGRTIAVSSPSRSTLLPEEFEAFLARSGQDLAHVVRDASITVQ